MSDEKIILGLDALRSVGHSDKARAIKDEIDRLRAANARLQAWHDVVVAARVVDAVDIGTAAMVLRQANGRILELQDAVDEIERRSVKAIIRPQPLAKE